MGVSKIATQSVNSASQIDPEGDEILERFLTTVDRHPALADARLRSSFHAFARDAGLGGYLLAQAP